MEGLKEAADAVVDAVRRVSGVATTEAPSGESNATNIIAKMLQLIFYNREAAVKAGANQEQLDEGIPDTLVDVFGDSNELYEMIYTLETLNPSLSFPEIIQSMDQWCTNLLESVEGVENIQELLINYMYFWNESKSHSSNIRKYNDPWKRGFIQGFGIFSSFFSPEATVPVIWMNWDSNESIDENLERIVALKEVISNYDRAALELEVGSFPENGVYKAGLLASEAMRDYLGDMIEEYGFDIEMGAAHNRFNYHRNFKFSYTFLYIEHNPVLIDVYDIPPRDKRNRISREDFDLYMLLIQEDIKQKEGT